MGRRGGLVFTALCFLLLSFSAVVFSIPSVSADVVHDEMQKITNYAQEYEIGNINYVELTLYLSASRERLNEVLGATGREKGGVLMESQLRQILGEPSENARWVWVENEQREERVSEDVPAWRKIIFDGKKSQVWLNAWPVMFIKGDEKTIYYNLHTEIRFKKPGEQLDILSEMGEIKSLAERYNQDPSVENAEQLAEKSVSAEKTFNSYMQQSSEKCEDVMASIFGTENQMADEKMIAQQVIFFEGDDFTVMANLEMCDECDSNWVSLNTWVETRGRGFKEESAQMSPDQFKGLTSEQFKSEITSAFDELKQACQTKDYGEMSSAQTKIKVLNEAWNQKTNEVWKQVDKEYEEQRKAMTQQEMEALNQNYGWIRQDQERKQRALELQQINYNEIKSFYTSLLSGYEKKEFYYTQVRYEKRLFEQFLTAAREVCNNNADDNEDGNIDCSDSQCQGKVCGKQSVKRTIIEGNETREVEEELFCISGTCQAREQTISEVNNSVCGNHICELNEASTCPEDCSTCPSYPPIECAGSVTFKGKDANGCPLEPICITENSTCTSNEQCPQPLCGVAECVEGACKTTALEQCRMAECVEGDEKMQYCSNGEKIISDKCINGVWVRTGFECEMAIELPVNTTEEEEIVGTECTVREDCGNENDVCSNGRCVTIPEVIVIDDKPYEDTEQLMDISEGDSGEREREEDAPQEKPENSQNPEQKEPQVSEPEQELQQESSPESSVTAQAVRAFAGFVVKLTGYEAEGETSSDTSGDTSTETVQDTSDTGDTGEGTGDGTDIGPPQDFPQDPQPPTGGQPVPPEAVGNPPQPPQENYFDEDREKDQERRENDDAQRREKDCGDMCQRMCTDSLVMPCMGKCSGESDCKGENCVEEVIKECEDKCKSEVDTGSCISDCEGKCKRGEKFEFKGEGEEKQGGQTVVYNAMGNCRTLGSKTESNIFFDGWGGNFEKARIYKQKYYSGGNSDWCKSDLESLITQRHEFESSFDDEFAKWFFETYLANSAEDWEQYVSGVYGLYWSDVDNSKQMTDRLNCLGQTELPFTPKLINVSYETEFGKLEFWEEIVTTDMMGNGQETEVITPYMKVWIFPPKEFIIHEMQTAMANHEFPGSSENRMEREKQDGFTEEEREMIKQDEKFMKKLSNVAENYDGTLNAVARVVDNGSVVFNVYVQVDSENVIKVQPMLPEEVPSEDVRIEMEFQEIYDLIYESEKEMQGERIETPPWGRQPGMVSKAKEIVDGIQMFFKVKGIINSAEITPEESRDDVESLINSFFTMMMRQGRNDEGNSTQMSGEDMKAAEEMLAKGGIEEK